MHRPNIDFSQLFHRPKSKFIPQDDLKKLGLSFENVVACLAEMEKYEEMKILP